MKRWIVALLVFLAVIVLLSPGLIGRLAERSLTEQLELAAARDPELGVRTVAFERGWFTSAGTHRVPLSDPRLANLLLFVTPGAAAATAGAGEAPVLIIETRLDHGLVPLGGAGRDASALLPALARGLSTLALEVDDGRVLPVPGELASRINLNGSAELDYRLPAGEQRYADLQAAWDGAVIGVQVSADGRALGLSGSFDDWRIDSGGQRLEFAAASVEVAVESTRHGFAVGDADLRVQGLTASDGVGFESLSIDASSALEGEQVNADVEVLLTGLAAAGGRFDTDMRLSVGGLTASTLGPLLRGLRRSALAAGGSAPLTPYPDLEFDLRRLLSGGATLTLEQLSLDTPDGELRATLDIALPSSDDLAEWTGLALAADATAEVAVPRALAERDMFAAQLRPLIAGGFLVLDGELYRLKAAYRRGIATVNGAPIPVPMPGS